MRGIDEGQASATGRLAICSRPDLLMPGSAHGSSKDVPVKVAFAGVSQWLEERLPVPAPRDIAAPFVYRNANVSGQRLRGEAAPGASHAY
ncbi:hypothetical protein MES5069_440064 [Mesorhizobium escarrei]|uniref:Uncharacterized protein n=1 Tax=Mesorhizobium escarrei TaxID=666018 RepID=A0ABM9E6E2_9HYPH|nr:hypothetical protein MES5069_440064 [Mesorhizobium escarrei]